MEPPQTETVEIVLNGETRRVPGGGSLSDLMRFLQVDPGRVAIELDRNIIHKAGWSETPVKAGARLEIVQFVGGG